MWITWYSASCQWSWLSISESIHLLSRAYECFSGSWSLSTLLMFPIYTARVVVQIKVSVLGLHNGNQPVNVSNSCDCDTVSVILLPLSPRWWRLYTISMDSCCTSEMVSTCISSLKKLTLNFIFAEYLCYYSQTQLPPPVQIEHSLAVGHND